MKLLTNILVILLLCCVTAHADFKMPPTKTGIAYSLKESGVNYLQTFEILKKDIFTLEAGIAGDVDESDTKLVAVASVDALNLDRYVEWPIAKYVVFRPGLYLGWGKFNAFDLDEADIKDAKFDWGLSLTALEFKF